MICIQEKITWWEQVLKDQTWKKAEEKYLEISYVNLLWEYFQKKKVNQF